MTGDGEPLALDPWARGCASGAGASSSPTGSPRTGGVSGQLPAPTQRAAQRPADVAEAIALGFGLTAYR